MPRLRYTIGIDAMTTAIRFTCANCSQTIKASSEQAGRTARCPSCKKSVTVPRHSEVRPVSDEFPLAAMSIGDEVNLEELLENEAPALIPPASARRTKPAMSADDSGRSARAIAIDAVDTESESVDDERRYPGLIRVRIAFQVLAVLTTITWLMSLGSYMLGLETPETPAGSSNAADASGSIFPFGLAIRFLVGGITLCGLYGASELIRVVLDIQERIELALKRRR